MLGGVFETNDTPDFAVTYTLFRIAECPNRLYTEVRIDLMLPRRYVRYRGAADKSYCKVAEIALHENVEDTVKIMGNVIRTPGSYDEAREYTSAWLRIPIRQWTIRNAPVLGRVSISGIHAR